MAEAGRSNEDTPQLCPCGFYGSPQTMNLCSKCHKEKCENAQEAKVESGLDSTDSAQDPTLLSKLGLLSSTSSSSTGTINSNANIVDEKVDNQETEVKEPTKDEENLNEVCLLPKDIPAQKNKKKCWVCKSRLELAQRELGLCKCGYTFCFLHRLPEQHECVYDHKEGGRQQALKTMVAAHKKIGRSFHRMDSRPE